MASEDIAKLAESLAKTKVGGGQLSFKGQSLKLNTAEDGNRKYTFRSTFLLHEKSSMFFRERIWSTVYCSYSLWRWCFLYAVLIVQSHWDLRKEFGYVSDRREPAACTFALNGSIPEYNCSTLPHLLNRHLLLPVSGNLFLLMWHPLPSYFRPFCLCWCLHS